MNTALVALSYVVGLGLVKELVAHGTVPRGRELLALLLGYMVYSLLKDNVSPPEKSHA